MEVLIYFLKSSVLLLLFYTVYQVLLKHDTYHQLKRLYLLSGLILSAVLPWIYYTKTVVVPKDSLSSTSVITQNISGFTEVSSLGHQVKDTLTLSWDEVLLMVYLLVATVLLVRFVYQFFKLHHLLRRSSFTALDTFKLHVVEDKVNPFSFFGHILINRADYKSENFNMIMVHEKVHVQQYHSLDILLTNVWCIFFWFNPLVWFYRRALVQNLEHIADDISVKSLSDTVKYQYLLLNRVCCDNPLESLQNKFFQSSIKQRIMMLNKSETPKIRSIKSLIVIPVLILFVMNFQIEVNAQEKESKDSNTDSYSSKYSEDLEPSISSPKKDPSGVNNYTIAPSFIDNKSANDENINEYDKIILLITKHADQKFLDFTEKHLEEDYGFEIEFNKVKFNDRGELISIEVNVNCNDGFEGSTQIIGKEPISNVYFYRDYTEYSSSPFGIGGDKSVIKELLQNTFSENIGIFFPRHDTFGNTNTTLKQKFLSEQNTDKTKSSENTLKAETFTEFKPLNKVETFIINGKSFELEELRKRKLIVESHQFLNEKTLEVYGEFKDDLLDQNIEAGTKLTYNNLKLILFGEFDRPIFLKLGKVSIEKK